MNSNKTILSAVLTVFGIATGLMQSSAIAADEAHSGTATVKLQHVYALQQTGSSDPAHDADCKKQLSQVNSKYLGLTVTTKYTINPKTLIMSAVSSFPSPVSTQPLQLSIDLSALGIAGSYSFGTFRPAALPEAHAVLFSVNQKYADAKSTFVVLGPKDQTYNCLISSTSKPFKTAEKARYGADAK
jgi:hypothetical protein